MFNSLSGIIGGKFPQTVHLDVHGVEWDICVPDSSLSALPAVGEPARVFTWLQHTGDIMRLYGFATESDRRLFLDLVSVDGIGPRGAVRIMSHISGAQLAQALDGGDVARLEKVPGIGRKTAAKMLLALKGRLSQDAGDARSARSGADGQWHDVIESLCDMGYDRARCAAVVQALAERLRAEDAGFAAGSKSAQEELVFRRAIVELA